MWNTTQKNILCSFFQHTNKADHKQPPPSQKQNDAEQQLSRKKKALIPDFPAGSGAVNEKKNSNRYAN